MKLRAATPVLVSTTPLGDVLPRTPAELSRVAANREGFLPKISAKSSFGPFSELERPHSRLGPWRTLRTCDRKTQHLVLNLREGAHDRHPTTCPAPIRQALWVGNQSTREPTDSVVLVGGAGDHATPTTWHDYLEQQGLRGISLRRCPKACTITIALSRLSNRRSSHRPSLKNLNLSTILLFATKPPRGG